MRKAIAFTLALCLCLTAAAQDVQKIPSAMEGNLKIYVVVAVLLIIFSGIILFLLGLDRRLKKLEEGK